MLSELYRNPWTNSQKHDIGTEPPWIQLYTSEQVAMGKSTLIQRDIQSIRKKHQKKQSMKFVLHLIIMNRFWSYHPCSNDSKGADIDEKNTLIIYHLNISSCVSKQMNDFLFELLFLQHINSNSRTTQCFHVNSNMIFLIEIPSTLDELNSTLSFKQFFYLLFSTVQFPTVQVSNQNNEFVFEKEAQYTIKWMQEFYNGNLKKRVIDPDAMANLEKDKMKRFMEKYFKDISRSNPAHQLSFFKYLYQQLIPLKNKFFETDPKSAQWKHDITNSVIEMAKMLCCRQYNNIKLNVEEKEQKIESTGQEEFYLCEKWHNSKECCYLVNQDGG
ncbi:hypothetical protein RFI_31758 [Reticulomyxa filosa]|uniref:Uncharacterized protein n=1 Tax=Reticulomyxa filosa TaxID=46433 RepID=X6LVI2_RETFI|nr:hypothetical protein RFI_31758 [Reticulomyxa filosa]|eukprot:ETO05639.1 hypothetical protein RFI_31758 [Reticulomyxa filosa]